MTLEVHEAPRSTLAEYARVPIALDVRGRLVVHAPRAGLRGRQLAVEPVVPPYVKDYDAEPGQRPDAWDRRFGLATRALARGAAWLRAETQNVDVAACRLYAGQGCVLGAVHRFACPTLPDEVQRLWFKPLPDVATRTADWPGPEIGRTMGASDPHSRGASP